MNRGERLTPKLSDEKHASGFQNQMKRKTYSNAFNSNGAYIPQLRHARLGRKNRRCRRPSRHHRHGHCPATGPPCAGTCSPEQTKPRTGQTHKGIDPSKCRMLGLELFTCGCNACTNTHKRIDPSKCRRMAPIAHNDEEHKGNQDEKHPYSKLGLGQ